MRNIFLEKQFIKFKQFRNNSGYFLLKSQNWYSGKTHPQVELKHLQEVWNTGIWVIGTLNQLFMRGSYTQTKFKKIKVVSAKPFFDSCMEILLFPS